MTGEAIQFACGFVTDAFVGGFDGAACFDLFEFGLRVTAELFFTGGVLGDLLDEPDPLSNRE